MIFLLFYPYFPLISKNIDYSILFKSHLSKRKNWIIKSVHFEDLQYENLVCLEELKEKNNFIFIVFRSTLNYKDKNRRNGSTIHNPNLNTRWKKI